jgi:hypothetical protein
MINLLKELNDCKNAEELENYLSINIDNVYDNFLNTDFIVLNEFKSNIDKYLSQNLRTITSIDLSNQNNLAYLSILLDISERFEFTLQFQRIYKSLKSKNYNFGERLEASSLFLIGIRTINDYQKVLDNFILKLSIAYSEEEDTEYKVIHTFINYYSHIVHNFSSNNFDKVCEIRNEIKEKSKQEIFHFLQNDTIDKVLHFDITDNIVAFENIQKELDLYLLKFRKVYVSNSTLSLLEKDTRYSMELDSVANNFTAIRQISVNKHLQINDSDVFYSLQRGVSILNHEKQLFAYMHSFGKMHYQKLITAFEYLPKDFFEEKTNIIDWGCGQAMATMVYLEYLQLKEIDQPINQIKLIEPSEIAIKRGALHIKKFNKNVNTITINKDLDSISNKDLAQNVSFSNLHLFSNIIDIDFFSLHQLLEKIETNYKGVNYFVCVSPYITDTKTNRIDNFVSYFNKFETTNIKRIDNQKGEWKGNGDWTRVVRIFKTKIA